MSRYMFTTTIASVLSWTAVVLVIIKLDPFSSPGISLSLFYLSLLFALIGTFAIFGFFCRRHINKNEMLSRHVSVSVRQAILLAVCTSTCVVFQMLGVLTWWDATLLIAITVLLEFYFSSQE